MTSEVSSLSVSLLFPTQWRGGGHISGIHHYNYRGGLISKGEEEGCYDLK